MGYVFAALPGRGNKELVTIFRYMDCLCTVNSKPQSLFLMVLETTLGKKQLILQVSG